MVNVGDIVAVKGEPGVVKFMGKTQFANGEWIGVELKNPVGRNDGSVLGIRYFQCSENYGVFVRPALVTPAPAAPHATASHVVEKLQKKLHNALTELEACRSTIAQLTHDIATKNEKIDELESALELSIVSAEHLEAQKTTLSRSLSDLNNQYELVKREYDDLREEISLNRQLEAEIRALGSSDLLLLDAAALLAHQRRLESEVASLKENKADTMSTIADLEHRLDSYDSLKTSYEKVSGQLLEAKDTIRELQNRLESLTDVELIVEHMTQENEQLSKKILELEQTALELTELHEIDKSLEDHHVQTEEMLKTEIQNLHAAIKGDKDTISQLSDNNRKLRKHIDALKGLQRQNPAKEESHQREKLIQQDVTEKKLQLRDHFISANISESLKNQLRLLMLIQDVKACVSILVEHSATTLAGFATKRVFAKCYAQLEYLETLLDFNEVDSSFIEDSLLRLNVVHSAVGDPEVDNKDDDLAGVGFVVERLHTMDLHRKNVSLLVLSMKILSAEADFQRSLIDRILGLVSSSGLSSELPDLHSLKVELSEIRSVCRRLQSSLVHQDKDLAEPFPLSVSLFEHYGQRLFKAAQKIEIEASALGTTTEDVLSVALETLRLLDSLKIKDVQHYVCSISEEEDFHFTEATSILVYRMGTSNGRRVAESTVGELIEKDKQIQDLKLSLDMLRMNMSSANTKLVAEKSELKEALEKASQDFHQVTVDFERLQRENIELDNQLRLLESSNLHFNGKVQTPVFENLKDMKEYTEKMAFIEEIVLLRKMLLKGHSPAEKCDADDVEWLKAPLRTPQKKTAESLRSVINIGAKKRAAAVHMMKPRRNAMQRLKFHYDRW